MTGTAAELTPMREIDDHAIGDGQPGAITRAVQASFEDALHGRSERYREWLDPVAACRRPHRRSRDLRRALRHDPARRHAGRGDVAVRAREAARRAPARRARHPPDRGRLPVARTRRSSSCSSCSRARRSTTREIAAFGMTRRRDVARRRGRRRCACWPTASRRSCTLVGKTWALHLEKVVRVDREENLRDDRRVGRVPRRRRASASSTTPSTSSTASATTATTRCAACARRPRRAPRRSCLCDTNGGSLPAPGGARRRARSSPRSATGVAGRHPLPQRRRVRRREHARRPSRPARTHVQGTMNGYGERCGNANLVSIIANLQLKLGHDVRRRRSAWRSSPRSRTSSTSCSTSRPTPTSRTSARTPSPTRAACTSPACARTPATFEHVDPDARRQPPRAAHLRAVRQGHGARAKAAAAGLTRRRRGRGARSIERVKELEHARLPLRGGRRLVRAAAAQGAGEYEPLFRLESWRVIVEKRADGKVETEATIKIWVDGERYVRTAEGNGPVNALDNALRDGDRRDPPAPARHRARQLQGPHPRREPRAPARSRACCSTPPTARTCGARSASSENVIEASWEALVDSLEYADAAGPPDAPPGGRRGGRALGVSAARRVRGHGADPARAARSSARRRRRGRSRCCAPASSRSARACRRSRTRSRARLGVGARQRGLERHRRPAPRAARGRRERRRRGRHAPVLVRRLGERLRLRARPAGVRRHRPGDAQPRPRRGRRRGDATARRALLPVHIFGYPADMPGASSASACRSSRTPARRSAPSTPTASPVGARGHPAVFGFYANKQLTTGEGGMVTIGRRRATKERIDSERNQGRAPDMGWLDHDRLGFNYRLSDLACALGPRAARAPRRHARRPRAGGRALPRGARRHRGPRRCRARTPAATSAAGSCSSSSSRAASTATTSSARCAERGIPSKPYLPAIHLMTLLPRAFGHREGEFPVCEDVAARSLALPFFPAMTDGPGRARREALARSAAGARPDRR